MTQELLMVFMKVPILYKALHNAKHSIKLTCIKTITKK